MREHETKNRGRTIRRAVALGLAGMLAWQASSPLATSVVAAFAEEGSSLSKIYGILSQSVGEPQGVQDYYELANISIGQGDYEAALEQLDKARTLLAEEMATQTDMKGGEQTEVGELDEDTVLMAELHLKTASVYILTGKMEEAKQSLDESLRLNPEVAQALLLRAQLDIEEGAYLPAIDDLLAYLELQPEDTSTRMTLAQLYENTADYVAAISQYEQLAEQMPEDESHTLNALRCMFLAGRYTEAIAGFDAYKERHAADETDPFGGIADFLRAACLMQQGEYVGAAEGFSLAIEAGYDKAVCLEQITLCRFETEEYDLVLAAGAELLEIPGAAVSSPELVHQRMGVSSMRLEDYESAIAQLDKAKELAPTLVGNEYYRGVCLMTLGRNEEAVEAFTASIEQAYLPQFCYYNRGVCYVEMAEYEKVIEDMSKTLESGDDPDLITAAKDILWQLANYYESLEAANAAGDAGEQ